MDGQHSERTLALRINPARALQETTMILITLLLILARPEFRKLIREELKANPGERTNWGMFDAKASPGLGVGVGPDLARSYALYRQPFCFRRHNR